MELTEKEAHCVARLIQGALFADNILAGREYCKFECFRDTESRNMFNVMRERFEAETGVDLNPIVCGLGEKHFPYRKFLKNSNDNIKKLLRTYFAGCLKVE